MPVLETKGALSAQGYGLTTAPPSNYIEDVFSTWLYTGNGSTQTITNNINLSGKGGLAWLKTRTSALEQGHMLFDTQRGVNQKINSNYTDAQQNLNNSLTAFNANGFNLGSSATGPNINSANYVSWTFRKQPKFFDIVTYSGTGANRTVAHNLGSVPGCIFVKRTDATANWQVYHRSLANTQYMVLNDTAAAATGTTRWNSTTPTSTVFSVGTDATVNASGGTYVAYIFAHNASGFGNAGTDNVISCGSFTVSSGTGNTDVNLGYEPQWLLVKPSTDPGFATNWNLYDTQRQWVNVTDAGNINLRLNPNSDNTETTDKSFQPVATGFTMFNSAIYPGVPITYIYIAIRRGPMKTPTAGTSVFGLNARTGTGANATVTGGQTDDAVLIKNRGGAIASLFSSRLTANKYLSTSDTSAEANASFTILQTYTWDVMDGVKVGTTSTITNASANTFINYLFRRAPGFFDVVCYTGTGANTTQTHNLGVVPELIIVKGRSGATAWQVYSSVLANTEYLVINTTAAKATGATRWNSTTPTSAVFSLGTASEVNTSSDTYVAYLFATVAGVSKVGSYTGTGATLTVNCGFTSGARFVLIKRTDLVGDWYVWDSARGIVAGNDPYWLLNSTAAEVTTTDWVDTASSGFELSNSVGNLANVIGGTYIFLSVA